MRAAFFLLVFALLPGSASPQTPGPEVPNASSTAQSSDTQATAAAIEAIVRGNYARAAGLLEPLVQRWTGNANDAAAFFLAALYDQGLGVPQDEARACALNVRSHESDGPFGRLGGELARAKMQALGPDWARLCMMLAHAGPNHGFAPARFALDVDHWVAIDLSTEKQQLVATVSYRNREKNASLVGPARGAVFLPIEYTRLGTGSDGATLRHFVEVAMWVPGDASTWSLQWSLGEIVEGDVVAVTTDTLTTIESDAPPADVLLQLRDLVALRVNDAGHAEFEIFNRPNAMSEGIPTAAERRELAEQTARRRTADEKVNWKRRRDAGRAPTFDYVDADGCHDMFVYGWSAGRADSIAIRADRQLLELSTSPRTFDLAAPTAEIEVVADVFERPQRQWGFCTDAGDTSVRHETWRAVAGTITIQLSAPGLRAEAPNRYRATIQIENAEFMNPAGALIRSSRPIRLTAVAGSSGAPPAQSAESAGRNVGPGEVLPDEQQGVVRR